MNLKVSMKVDGKWLTVGNIKINQWGNLSLGLRKSPEVRKALEGEGWANFSLFEDKPKEGDAQKPAAKASAPAAELLDDEIAF